MQEERYLTVTALTKYIKYKFDHDHNLEEVLLEGEISNFKHNSRGHFYFTLKDESSAISAAMFSTYARNVVFEPKDGMKVYVRGKVTVYEPSGTYSINVVEMKSNGIGDLYLAYQKLFSELEKKGLFLQSHKKPIPKYPNIIGVITSPTGAAIKDIINTVGRRYPLAEIILYPAIVQGDDAKKTIVSQIEHANKDNLADVLIVGRGGGSIEDLWAFNEEVVANAIYNSNIPIISAVGHDIDFTIADFVADLRAATPTAGAELATPNIYDIKETIRGYLESYTKRINYIIDKLKNSLMEKDRLLDAKSPLKVLDSKYDLIKHKMELINKRMENILMKEKTSLMIKEEKLKKFDPKELIKTKKEELALKYDNLNQAFKNILILKKHEFDLKKAQLESVNPLTIMDKGYSILKKDDKVVKNVKDIKVGDTINTYVKNGIVVSNVVEVKENGK